MESCLVKRETTLQVPYAQSIHFYPSLHSEVLYFCYKLLYYVSDV